MSFQFPAGFAPAVDRLGNRYNNGAYNPTTNPGGFDNEGHVPNFAPALNDAAAAAQGLAAFAAYLETSVSPLAQQAVDAAALTAADRVATGQDRTATGQDRTATGQDRTITGQDRNATNADRVQTGQDRVRTGEDRVATGQDKAATAADRVATGQDRSAASASATQAAQSANNLAGTSATSNTIGTGQKTFATQAGKFFGAGSAVVIVSDSNPASLRMAGNVASYSGTTLTVNVSTTAGTGTYADWTIRVSGAAGQTGNSGWTPVLANVSRGNDVVQQVVDWTGGTGAKPTTGVYVGPAGLTGNIADAVNVRGIAGSGTGNVNTSGPVEANHVALFSDTTGQVLKSGGALAEVATTGDYADLANTPTIPTTPGDIGAAEASALTAHTGRTDNPHGTTKAQVGLGEVDNTSDAAKPISTATADALAGKAATAHTHTVAQISDATANGRAILTAADYAAMRQLLGLRPGTDVQAFDADLQAIAALATTAFGRNLLTLADAAGLSGSHGHPASQISDASANGRAILTAADYAAIRSLLSLGALALKATVNNGDWSGADLALANGGTGASDAPAARANLGLGNVDNTSDADKPVSTAQQTALALKADKAQLGSIASRNLTVSTADPSGGVDGDIWFKV